MVSISHDKGSIVAVYADETIPSGFSQHYSVTNQRLALQSKNDEIIMVSPRNLHFTDIKTSIVLYGYQSGPASTFIIYFELSNRSFFVSTRLNYFVFDKSLQDQNLIIMRHFVSYFSSVGGGHSQSGRKDMNFNEVANLPSTSYRPFINYI